MCEDENKKLRNENKILQKTLNKLDTSLKSVTKANNDLEQYNRRECVEIRGVPQKPDKSTNAELLLNTPPLEIITLKKLATWICYLLLTP